MQLREKNALRTIFFTLLYKKMKTKLLTMTVAGLAFFGGLTGITLAQGGGAPGGGYDTINGF